MLLDMASIFATNLEIIVVNQNGTYRRWWRDGGSWHPSRPSDKVSITKRDGPLGRLHSPPSPPSKMACI
jgi:hypothetical protein